MIKVEFPQDSLTGHPEIDADHRLLVDMGNEIEEALAAGQLDRGRRLFDSLIEEAKDHFGREEIILRDLDFPGQGAHLVYHWNLIRRAERLRLNCDKLDDPGDKRSCLEMMVSFVIDDVLRGDRDITTYLIEMGKLKS